MLWLLAMRGLHGAAADDGGAMTGACLQQGRPPPAAEAAPCDAATPAPAADDEPG